MKFIVVFVMMSLYLFPNNLSVRYFELEHDYDKYKLEKKPIFIKEILDNNLSHNSNYVKVYYLDNKIIKYENYDQKNKRVFETFFDKKERISKGVGIDGYEYECFYNENMIITKSFLRGKKTIIKSFYVNNRMVSTLEYDEKNKLTSIKIYDFKNWKQINYDGDGNFIDKIFLPKPNK